MLLSASLLVAVDAGAQTAPPLARVRTQVVTARTHAGFAVGATTLGDYQQHMGHVLNCVEGRSGRNFNSKWGHVCEGQGNGILADLREAGRTQLVLFAQQAGANALSGTMTTRLNEAAKEVADGVEAMLEMVEDGL